MVSIRFLIKLNFSFHQIKHLNQILCVFTHFKHIFKFYTSISIFCYSISISIPLIVYVSLKVLCLADINVVYHRLYQPDYCGEKSI